MEQIKKLDKHRADMTIKEFKEIMKEQEDEEEKRVKQI